MYSEESNFRIEIKEIMHRRRVKDTEGRKFFKISAINNFHLPVKSTDSLTC